MPRVSENHAYEQFFFSDETTRRLTDLAAQFSRPLLLCTPSIAEALEDKAMDRARGGLRTLLKLVPENRCG